MQPSTSVSTSAARTGARYPAATSRSSGEEVSPASTNSTKRGQAARVSVTSEATAKASSYERDAIVPIVPITPMRPVLVCLTAARAAGWMTSTTGMPYACSYRSRASRSTAEDAVLHAMTSAFTPCSTRSSITCRA